VLSQLLGHACVFVHRYTAVLQWLLYVSALRSWSGSAVAFAGHWEALAFVQHIAQAAVLTQPAVDLTAVVPWHLSAAGGVFL